MIQLKLNSDFHKHLKPGIILWQVSDGILSRYRFACWHPDTSFNLNKESFIVVNEDRDVYTASVITIPENAAVMSKNRPVFLIGNYDSKEIGEIRIQQIQQHEAFPTEALIRRINAIRRIYSEQ